MIRSAASRTPIDLIAINPRTKQIFLIQCKAGKVTKKEKERILQELESFLGTYWVHGVLESKA